MSGDSALEHSPTNGAKRRRTFTGDGCAPAAKKSYTDAEVAAEVAYSLNIREQRRAEVRAIYLNYGTLLKGGESASEALAFQGVLDCANGTLGARRLAARLVPRFLPRFPSHVEQAFRLLTALYGHGQAQHDPRGCPNGKDPLAAVSPSTTEPVDGPGSGAPGVMTERGVGDFVELETAMRRDALLGLGNVLEAAIRQAERSVPVVLELALFLMRHLRRLHAAGITTTGAGGPGGKDARGPSKLSDATLQPKVQAQPEVQPPVQQQPQNQAEPQAQPPSITQSQPQPQPEPQPQPQLQPQPSPVPQPETSSMIRGHGLKHRYRRNADAAAANAEANGGAWGCNQGRGPTEEEAVNGAQPSSSPPATSAPAPPGSRAESAAGTSKTSGSGSGYGVGAVKLGAGGDGGAGCSTAEPASANGTAEPDSEGAIIQNLLGRAFCLFPRVVLAACFQPYRLPPKQRAPEDCEACELLLELLLRPASADALVESGTATAGSATGPVEGSGADGPCAGSSGAGEAGQSRTPGGTGGEAAGGALSGDVVMSEPGQGSPEGFSAPDGSGLAARVLMQLPETQSWLRQLAMAMVKGKTSHSLPSSVQTQLDRLLLYCSPVPPPAAATAAAAEKVSPRASPGTVAAPPTAGAAAVGASAAQPTPARQSTGRLDGPVTATAAQSMVGSDDNSRSVPMDLDHSISTAVRPEGSGAAAAAGAGAGFGSGAAAALAGPADTAATPAPPPPPLPQTPFGPPNDAAMAAAQAAALQPPLPPPPPPPPLPSYPSGGSSGLRGGPVCRAEACLYIGGLPPGLTEASLVSELGRCGAVESVHPFDQQQVLLQHTPHCAGLGASQVPVGEEVYVVFVSLRDAAFCYEAVSRTCRFGGTRPLVVEFCSAFPADSPAARRSVAAAAAAAAAGGGGGPGSTASEFVWVSLSAGAGVTPEAVVAALQAASLPVPQQILQVAGRAPGMLLHMSSASIVPQVTGCLQSHFTPPPLPPPPLPAPAAASAGAPTPLPPPPPPPPGMLLPFGAPAPGGAGGPSGMGPMGAQTPPPGSSSGGLYGGPLHMQQAGPGGGGSAVGVPAADPAPLNCRTIWVGQLHEAVRDEELLSACRLHGGEVVGYRFLRASHCAFVDFASQSAAEAAKRALHGMRLGPQHIRVEWKLDSGPPPRAPLTLRHGGTPLSGHAMASPVGGMYGMGPGAAGSGMAGAPAGPQGLAFMGSGGPHGSSLQQQQQQQQQTPGGLAMGMMGQQMTPQAVAAANVAAAAAAAAARGAFPGGRTGADRWAPVVMPPAANPAPAAASTAVGGGAGPMVSAGSGFMGPGQLPSQPQMPVGPFGGSVMNPAVAAAARQAAPLIMAHQQMVAGRGHGMVSPQHAGGFAQQQQTPTQPSQQQQQTHQSSGSSGGALPLQPAGSQGPMLPSSQVGGHLHPTGGYPGPPPLQPPQSQPQSAPVIHQSSQGPLGLHSHSSAPLPLHHPLAMGPGAAGSHQHLHSAQPHGQQQPHPQRHGEWPQHGHGHGLGSGQSAASPGVSGGGAGVLGQPQRFESGPGAAPPLPNSPPPPPDSFAAGGSVGASGGPPLPLPPLPPQPHSQHLSTQGQQQQPAAQHGQPQAYIHISHGHQLPPHHHPQQQQQQQQLPPPPLQQHVQPGQHHHPQHGPPAGGPPVVTWQGGLAKSGMHMCSLQCTSGGASAASGATPGEREPVTWPATLDVKLRVDLSYVVHSLYSHTAPHARAMRRLVTAGGPEQRNKLSEFLSYLADKNRAGVIKLDAAAGLPARTLYLVPPSEQVCAALGTEWSTAEPFLLALVVPTAGGTFGGNKG